MQERITWNNCIELGSVRERYSFVPRRFDSQCSDTRATFIYLTFLSTHGNGAPALLGFYGTYRANVLLGNAWKALLTFNAACQYKPLSRYERGATAIGDSKPLAVTGIYVRAKVTLCLGHTSNKCVSHGWVWEAGKFERASVGPKREKEREGEKAGKGSRFGRRNRHRRHRFPTSFARPLARSLEGNLF